MLLPAASTRTDDFPVRADEASSASSARLQDKRVTARSRDTRQRRGGHAASVHQRSEPSRARPSFLGDSVVGRTAFVAGSAPIPLQFAPTYGRRHLPFGSCVRAHPLQRPHPRSLPADPPSNAARLPAAEGVRSWRLTTVHRLTPLGWSPFFQRQIDEAVINTYAVIDHEKRLTACPRKQRNARRSSSSRKIGRRSLPRDVTW